MRLENQGLSRKVEDHVGPDLVEYVGQTAPVAYVSQTVVDSCLEFKEIEHRWGGGDLVGIASHICSQMVQPQGQPRALETGVARH